MPNHLSLTSSPYLLQHAGNPVNWYPWESEALEIARNEDKPIFLSIGYAACHWCHVMAHESFEDQVTAELMNKYFVNIKVDREERPDLDSIYMNFVVAMTGQGGWPMSVFLTPERKPFYGGTYFPPVRRHNLPSFREVLETIARLWKDDRQRLVSSSEEMVEHLLKTRPFGASEEILSMESLEQVNQVIAKNYDWQFGGWGGAPKFPQPMLIEYLLRQGSRGDQDSLDIARHALLAMAQGGMYDILGGGFARYSVDPTWLIPHFEKMLYDNAQLALTYLHAYLLTEAPAFREVCEATLDFVLREMTGSMGGFYSSLDADSEGEEGKYYAWTAEEVRAILKDAQDANLFMETYGISEQGNFEGRNILRRLLSDAQILQIFNLEVNSIDDRLKSLRGKLMERRKGRVRPNIDDKVLVSWNALMMAAFAEAGRSLQREDYTQAAIRNANFIIDNMLTGRRLMHAWRDGKVNHPAYLEDHAALALGLLSLYETDPDPKWYQTALRLVEQIFTHFADPGGGFFDTRDDQETLIYRPKDIQDNATPSGNALAANALLVLSAFEGNSEWHDQALNMITANLGMIKRYPTAFAQWLCAMDFALGPVHEVAIVGETADPATQALLEPLRKGYHPRLVVAHSAYPPPPGSPTLVKERPLINGKPSAYICRSFVCQKPVNTPAEMLELMAQEKPGGSEGQADRNN